MGISSVFVVVAVVLVLLLLFWGIPLLNQDKNMYCLKLDMTISQAPIFEWNVLSQQWLFKVK